MGGVPETYNEDNGISDEKNCEFRFNYIDGNMIFNLVVNSHNELDYRSKIFNFLDNLIQKYYIKIYHKLEKLYDSLEHDDYYPLIESLDNKLQSKERVINLSVVRIKIILSGR